MTRNELRRWATGLAIVSCLCTYAVGVDATLVLAGTLMCVPNFLVLVFVPEVRSVQRREEPETQPEAEPALLPL